MGRGLTEAEAREEARARFGDERAYRRRLEQIDEGKVRMRKRSELLDTVVRTLGLSLRGVRRSPGFTASVVVILALGIGANAVMFGVVDRLGNRGERDGCGLSVRKSSSSGPVKTPGQSGLSRGGFSCSSCLSPWRYLRSR